MPLKLASREYVHILWDAALLPLKGRYVIVILKEKKEEERNKWLMILITTIIMEAGSRYTQQYYTGSWRHYLNYYHRLIQTASVIAGHDRS